MSSLISKIFIKFSCQKVGSDEFGNEYYQNKQGKRFVVYNGIAEPSKIPSEWFVWIHYSSNVVPLGINTRKASWQKIHTPNLTGTKNAYSPKDSASSKTSSIYKSWDPNKPNA